MSKVLCYYCRPKLIYYTVDVFLLNAAVWLQGSPEVGPFPDMPGTRPAKSFGRKVSGVQSYPCMLSPFPDMPCINPFPCMLPI